MSAKTTEVECPAGPQFGAHGGRQFRSPHYFRCGCDAGYCEKHAVARPFGPPMERGEPRMCRKSAAKCVVRSAAARRAKATGEDT